MGNGEDKKRTDMVFKLQLNGQQKKRIDDTLVKTFKNNIRRRKEGNI